MGKSESMLRKSFNTEGEKRHLLLKVLEGKKKHPKSEKKAASTDRLHLKNQYNILLGINCLLLPVPVDTVKITLRWIMRSANWKMSMLYKVLLTRSVLSVAGTVTPLFLSLSLSVYGLVCCEQWNSEAVIPLVLVHRVGQRVNEEGGGQQTPPWGNADRGPTLSHTLYPVTDQHRWIQTRNAVGGLAALMSGPDTMALSVSLIHCYQ